MAQTQRKKRKKQKVAVINEPKVNLKGYWIFLGLISFLLFANTISHDYNMDDNLVTQNHKLTSKGFEAIGEIFNSSYHSDEMGYAYGYRPITQVSFAIEHGLFGESAKTSHTINVLLFALCVILLFQLIIRWMGHKSIYLALIAALFFAVHPIHSEVVASIKNRDEILAFLFAILSALAVHKYAQHKKFWHMLVLGGLYFAIGMLAKKSIYPLVFVLPIAAILFTNNNWKQIILIAGFLALPSAWIGSEGDEKRLALMFFLPLTSSFILHYIFTILKQENWKELIIDRLKDKKILLFGFGLTTALVLLTQTHFLILLTVPFIIQFIRIEERIGVVLFSVQLLIIGIFLQHGDYFLLSFIMIVGYTFFMFKKGKKDGLFILLSCAIILLAFGTEYYEEGWQWKNPARLIALLFFMFTFFYARWVSLIYLVLVVIVAGVWFNSFEDGEIPSFLLVLITASLIGLIDLIKKSNFIRYIPIALFLIVFLDNCVSQIIYSTNQNKQDDLSWVYQEFDAANQGKGEGRKLDFVENTLVAPHSNAEEIATGLLTLGEYARLMVYPQELLFYYGFAKINTTNFGDIWVWLSILFHVGLIIIAVYFARSKPIISLGVIWYMLSIFLFSNLVTYIAGMVGERLAFTASAGFAIAFAGIILHFRPNFNFIQFKKWEIIVITILVLFAGRTFIRNNDWKDPITLMTHDIGYLENSAQANNLLALNLMMISTTKSDLSQPTRLSMQKKAVKHFTIATEIWPYFFNAHFDKGRSAFTVGDYTTAIQGFEKTIEIDPKFMSPYFSLFDIYRQQNNTEAYKKTAQKLLSEYPKNKEALNYMFNGYFYNQQQDSALIIIEKALKLYPNDENYKNTYNALQQQ